MVNIKDQVSLKRLALSKANARMVAAAAIGAFITVFCLSATHYFLDLHGFQAKILAADNTADQRLKSDVTAKNSLVSSYEKFAAAQPNVLGTSDTSSGHTYNNSVIILDALPSKYDFPGFITTLDNLLQKEGIGTADVESIGGTDETGQVSTSSSPKPESQQIPFSFTVNNVTYQTVQNLFKAMQSSILPLSIDNMTISGTDNDIVLSVNGHSYFQQEKEFKIGSETISR